MRFTNHILEIIHQPHLGKKWGFNNKYWTELQERLPTKYWKLFLEDFSSVGMMVFFEELRLVSPTKYWTRLKGLGFWALVNRTTTIVAIITIAATANHIL